MHVRSSVLPGALVLGLGLPTLLTSTDAAACSPGPARNHILVESGATIPANVRGIPLSLTRAPETTTIDLVSVATSAAVSHKVEGPAAGTTDQESYIIPTTAFTPGEYRLEIPQQEGEIPMATFTVVAAAPAPIAAVKVTIGNPRRATVKVSGGAACVDDYDASVLDVTVSVAEDYRPYRHLVAVNGTKSDPGAFLWTLTSGGPFGPPAKGIAETLSETYVVARPCSQGAGRASVTFASRVRGLTGAEATASADLDFAACESLAKGQPTPAGTTVTESGTGTPTSNASTPSAATDGDGGGCTVMRRRSGGTGTVSGIGVFLALTALAARRRRAISAARLRG